jgi:RNA polymerase sigma-70 factor (ECF subfamily)
VALSDVPAELVDRCKQGDPGAFDELFTLIHEDLYRWAYSMVRNEDDAMDVAQDCFLRIFRHLGRLQDSRKFAQWCSRLLVNQANTFRVRRRKHQTEELEDGFDVGEESLPLQGRAAPSPRTAASQREVLEQVNAAIRELPPRQRTAVLLFDVKQMTIREVAEQLGCSEGAVKFNIHQGRRKLRVLLGNLVDKDGNISLPE